MSHCVMFKKTADPVADPGSLILILLFFVMIIFMFFFFGGGIYYFIIYKINLLKSKIVPPPFNPNPPLSVTVLLNPLACSP